MATATKTKPLTADELAQRAADARAEAEQFEAQRRDLDAARRRQEHAGRIAAVTAWTEPVEAARAAKDTAAQAYQTALDGDDPATLLTAWRTALTTAAAFQEAASQAQQLAQAAGIDPLVHYRPPTPHVDPAAVLAEWASRAAKRAAHDIAEQAALVAQTIVAQHVSGAIETVNQPTVWTFTAPRNLVLGRHTFVPDPRPNVNESTFTTADPSVAAEIRRYADTYDLVEVTTREDTTHL